MKKFFTYAAMLCMFVSAFSQNVWDGSESTNFSDTANWSGDQDLTNYTTCNIGSGTYASIYNANGKFYNITMIDGGDLTVTNTLYANRLTVNSDGANSNIVVKDGGLLSVRNSASDNGNVGYGTITILDGGAFECKSNIYFIWGRWTGESCTFNLYGGTANFTQFAPWRNGYTSNTAQIVLKGGGVGTHSSGSLKTWAENDKVVPAEGSLLTYTPTEPNRMSSIDLPLADSYNEAGLDGVFTVPSYFDVYATGDLEYDTTITVTQTPEPGTLFYEGNLYTIEVNATDYFGNTISKSIEISVYGIATEVASSQTPKINIYPNPSGGTFTLSGIESDTKVSIYNTSGKEVYQNDFTNCVNQTINSNLPAGIYLIKVDAPNLSLTKKLVIQ